MVIRTAQSQYGCPVELETCCGTLEAAFNSEDQARKDIAQRCLNSAWEILYALSGRQFGVCETTIRPCRLEECDPCQDRAGYRWTPVLVGGEWTNVSCNAHRSDSCSCTEVCDVILPGPIDSITEVKLDGVVLPNDGSAYRVDDKRSLVALKKPSRIQGGVVIGGAFLDPSATFTFDQTPTSTEFAVDLGNNTYGPTGGIIRATFLDIDCVRATYNGPDDASMVITRPVAPGSNQANEAWEWPVPGTVLDVGSPVASSVHDDESSVVATLIEGGAVTQNANPGPLARGLLLTPGSTVEFCPSQLEEFCWPTCQDMNADPDQEGTWEVTYMRGRPVPQAGLAAIGELACELCKACIGDETCCLPSRVTSVSRQGVSFAILDPMTFINEGLTGIYMVDLWIRSMNPAGRTRRATLLSPDMPLPRRTTWP